MNDGDPCKLQEECGVFACVASGKLPTDLDVANIIALGLIGLQHRGQESAGIVTGKGSSNERLQCHKGMGLVGNIFNPSILSNLSGNLGIGHNRYSTHGSSNISNCQPFVVEMQFGHIAVAHNGELVNKNRIRDEVMRRGVGLSSGSDSELIIQLLCMPVESEKGRFVDWPERLKKLMQLTPTAYSIVLLHGDCVYAARDPLGNRPLCAGRLVSSPSAEKSQSTLGYVVSSESCVFESMGAHMMFEIRPGEIVKVDKHGITSVCVVSVPDSKTTAFCIFEYVYFARSDSFLEGQMVYTARKQCGKILAVESPVDADIVGTVPDSAVSAAIGYAEESGLPYDNLLARNRYIGRTFIQPSTRLRQLAVAKKFGVLKDNVNGKRIVVVDDSIVRGTTMSSIISMLRAGGATEVHVRIASPPVKYPCYMGINIPTPEELLANQLERIEDITNYIGADSLAYLSVQGLHKAINKNISLPSSTFDVKGTCIDAPYKNSRGDLPKRGHCAACLTGDYPVSLDW